MYACFSPLAACALFRACVFWSRFARAVCSSAVFASRFVCASFTRVSARWRAVRRSPLLPSPLNFVLKSCLTRSATLLPSFCVVLFSCAAAFSGVSVFWSMETCIFAESAPDWLTIFACWLAVAPWAIITPIEAAAEATPQPMPSHMPRLAASRWLSAWSWIAFWTFRFSAVRISRCASRCDWATSIISASSAYRLNMALFVLAVEPGATPFAAPAIAP